MGQRAATAAILLGGDSTRMGRDKASLHWEGRPLLAHVHKIVEPLVREVLLVTRPGRVEAAQALAPAGTRVLADTATARGPLAGIHAALRGAAHDSVLVVACDMPRINPALLEGLLDDPQGDVVIPRHGRHFEPLLAVYRRSCLPAIEAVLEEGSARVPAFFSTVVLSIWDERRLRNLDPELLSLTNWNRRRTYLRPARQTNNLLKNCTLRVPHSIGTGNHLAKTKGCAFSKLFYFSHQLKTIPVFKPLEDNMPRTWRPYIAGALVGVLAILSVVVSTQTLGKAKYLGASTTFVRSAGLIEQTVAADHVPRTPTFRARR